MHTQARWRKGRDASIFFSSTATVRPTGVEHRVAPSPNVPVCKSAAANSRHAAAHSRRSIRHRAPPPARFFQMLLDVTRRPEAATEITKVFSLSSVAISFNTSPTTCGFKPNKQYPLPSRFSVVIRHADAKLFRQRRGFFAVLHRRRHALRRKQSLLQNTRAAKSRRALPAPKTASFLSESFLCHGQVLFLTLPRPSIADSLTAVPRVSWGKMRGHEIPLRCVHRLRAPCALRRIIFSVWHVR